MLVYANYTDIFYHRSMEKDTPCRSRLSVERKIFETPRSDQFDIKKVGIQTNKPLNWHHGGYTYRLISHIF